MSALNRLLAPLAAEFAGNARLRWGVWLILGIVLFYCVLVRSERVVAVHEEYTAEAERLMKAEALLERRDWPELLEAERKTHRELTAVFWQAETEGLAQAKLQAALNGMVEGLRLLGAQVRPGLSRSVPDLPGIWRVQIRLDAQYRPGVELRLLHAVATYSKKLIVDHLDLYRRRRQDSRLALSLSAYFVGVEAERR